MARARSNMSIRKAQYMTTDVSKFDKQMKAVSLYATFMQGLGYLFFLVSLLTFILFNFVTPAGNAEQVENTRQYLEGTEWATFVLGVLCFVLSYVLRCLYWISKNTATSSTPAGE